jgi:hypothetical protein
MVLVGLQIHMRYKDGNISLRLNDMAYLVLCDSASNATSKACYVKQTPNAPGIDLLFGEKGTLMRTYYKRVRATATKRACIEFWNFTTVGSVFPANRFRTEDGGQERVEQFPLVRECSTFSYKGIEYRVTKSCYDEVHCTAYYPHTSAGVRLLLDRAATHEAISLSLANLSDLEYIVDINIIYYGKQHIKLCKMTVP